MKTKIRFSITILVTLFLFIYGCESKDQEGNSIESVKIGTQEWMIKNLDVEHYRNGDIIPQVQNAKEWINLTTGAWCYYDNDIRNRKQCGKLYNWYAINDPRGLSPKGWHIPNDTEWSNMINYLGGTNVAGCKLKQKLSFNTMGTNESGFSAYPTGYRGYKDGIFEHLNGLCACFWSSTSIDINKARSYFIFFDISCEVKDRDDYNTSGYSVRCIKD